MSQSATGEFALIERYFAQPARLANQSLPASDQPLLGIGDDCALLAVRGEGRVLAVSTDMLVQGRHFFSDVDPCTLGHKALAVNLSDLAAMGARPLGFTLALALPTQDELWLAPFSEGLMRLSQRYACPLIGGDTTQGPLTISITIFGDLLAKNALRRDRAEVGDLIWVSGVLGAAAFAVDCLARGESLPANHLARRALEVPEPRVTLGRALAESGLVHAAVDLSDGVVGDLSHILQASGVGGAVLEGGQMPWAPCLLPLIWSDKVRFGLAGGDDYELLFTAPADSTPALLALARELATPLICIGKLTGSGGIQLRDASGSNAPITHQAYDHFRDRHV